MIAGGKYRVVVEDNNNTDEAQSRETAEVKAE